MKTPLELVESTDLSDFNIFEGDCVNIAVALNRVYDGELVASYATELDFQEGKPAHTAALIDGQLYDGNGKTSREALRDRAYYGVKEQDYDEIIIAEIPEPDTRLLDETVVQKLVEKFERRKTL